MKTSQILVSEIAIDVERKDIKNLHLGVYPPNGRVRIAAPLKVKEEAIRLFAVSKLSWIKKQKRKFDQQERQTERDFVSGESHYYKGKRYLLNLIPAAKTKIILRHRHIDLYIKPAASKLQKEKSLNRWYRTSLKEQIPSIIHKWEEVMNVSVEEWGVKQMKTKWGTCNIDKKRIWINLQLAKKPVQYLEYIILHEMVHLLERHHNEKFEGYMNKFMPQWKHYREELNRLPI